MRGEVGPSRRVTSSRQSMWSSRAEKPSRMLMVSLLAAANDDQHFHADARQPQWRKVNRTPSDASTSV